MPHQCVRCSKLYEDGSKEILTGCSCGAKLFFYINKAKLEQAQKITAELSDKDKVQIEKDVMDIVGDEVEDDSPVVLDIEAIRVVSPGKFELDLAHLFNKDKPLIYKLEEGKYVIDIAESFRKKSKD